MLLKKKNCLHLFFGWTSNKITTINLAISRGDRFELECRQWSTLINTTLANSLKPIYAHNDNSFNFMNSKRKMKLRLVIEIIFLVYGGIIKWLGEILVGLGWV